MIDLHIHTQYSDGSDSVKEILEKAEKKKIEYISITDHNTCRAYEELKTISKDYTSKVISGCELTAILDGSVIEILGYQVDTDYLNTVLPKIYVNSGTEINQFEVSRLIEICKKLGMRMDEGNICYDLEKDYGNQAVHEEITRYKENKKFFESKESYLDSYVFYRNCICNPESKFFIDESSIMPSAKEVISIIQKAGGLVFIPHIYVYKDKWKKILTTLLKYYPIDGLECFYPTFSKEQSKQIQIIAEKHHLYKSGGSDYHGKNRPKVQIGTGLKNLNIHKSIVEEWIK